ncbi:MAG TPA: hypothetical protein VE078_09875, partial [Thermoanaerobaculia bacterium]|nr:hypothetical protein [Thermoanaerobaculia bacterium]
IQWNADGTPFGNCGHDYYYNGLGVGLHMDVNTSEVQAKVDEALCQYGWANSPPTWNNTPCFGIYRGVRPLKALASAIGLDAPTYGGGNCGLDFFTLEPCRLMDTRQAGGPLEAGERRKVSTSGHCGIPATAKAVSLNLTAVEPTVSGRLTLLPDGCPSPNTNTVGFSGGQTRASSALLRISGGPDPGFAVEAVLGSPGAVHFVVDVNGYFE